MLFGTVAYVIAMAKKGSFSSGVTYQSKTASLRDLNLKTKILRVTVRLQDTKSKFDGRT